MPIMTATTMTSIKVKPACRRELWPRLKLSCGATEPLMHMISYSDRACSNCQYRPGCQLDHPGPWRRYQSDHTDLGLTSDTHYPKDQVADDEYNRLQDNYVGVDPYSAHSPTRQVLAR